MKMKLFDSILIGVMFFGCALSQAAPDSKTMDFSVKTDTNGAYLLHPKLGDTSFELSVYTGQAEILETRLLENNKHVLIIYKAGIMGTSHKVYVQRAKVLNMEKKLEVIDEIWKYKDEEGNADKQVVDPEWTFTASKILIKTSSSDSPESIPLY